MAADEVWDGSGSIVGAARGQRLPRMPLVSWAVARSELAEPSLRAQTLNFSDIRCSIPGVTAVVGLQLNLAYYFSPRSVRTTPSTSTILARKVWTACSSVFAMSSCLPARRRTSHPGACRRAAPCTFTPLRASGEAEEDVEQALL